MSITNTKVNDSDSVFARICLRIILEQENIVGILSWNEAAKVDGLAVIDRQARKISITGNPQKVVDDLVECYVKLFGRLSREISRESVVDLTVDIPAQDMPESLKR